MARLQFEHEKLKMEQEIELPRIDSQERQTKQDIDAKFLSELELGKLGEKAAHAPNPTCKLPYFEKIKIRWIVTYPDLRSMGSQINGIRVYGPHI